MFVSDEHYKRYIERMVNEHTHYARVALSNLMMEMEILNNPEFKRECNREQVGKLIALHTEIKEALSQIIK